MKATSVLPRTISDLRGDAANPREMTDQARAALRSSLEHFGDLSGIVFNRRTGELVTGHQRVAQIRERYGDQPITLIDEAKGLYGIFIDEHHYFPVRVVDWPRAMQRAANVAANNRLIQGTFTDDLEEYLLDVEAELSETMPGIVQECRFDELLALELGAVEQEEVADDSQVLGDIYQIIIECQDEAEQRALYDRLRAEGLQCKPLTI